MLKIIIGFQETNGSRTHRAQSLPKSYIPRLRIISEFKKNIKKFSGVGKSAWLLWIIVAVLLQMITFIVIYVKLTITEFQKQQIVHQEQARLLDQEDGKPLQYGGGMMYR